jgi:S1-C subfamily serine protease
MINKVQRGTYVLAVIVCVALPSDCWAQIPDAIGGKVPTLAPLVREVTPSVVNISVQGRVKEESPIYRDPRLREFYDGSNAIEREVQAVGSGVIVDAQHGYVLTANHVVAQVSTAQVTTKDGHRFLAKLVGRDPGTDLAVLRLQDAQSIKAIPMGDSDKLEVGDFVLAIGNPFGLGQAVTSGLVSALGRTGLAKQGYEDFIQTDAPINPGNSGGALVNLRGQLVGINTAIFSPAGGNVGIGFAVPINMAPGDEANRATWQRASRPHRCCPQGPHAGRWSKLPRARGRGCDSGGQPRLYGGTGRTPERGCRRRCRRDAYSQRRGSSQ